MGCLPRTSDSWKAATPFSGDAPGLISSRRDLSVVEAWFTPGEFLVVFVVPDKSGKPQGAHREGGPLAGIAASLFVLGASAKYHFHFPCCALPLPRCRSIRAGGIEPHRRSATWSFLQVDDDVCCDANTPQGGLARRLLRFGFRFFGGLDRLRTFFFHEAFVADHTNIDTNSSIDTQNRILVS